MSKMNFHNPRQIVKSKHNANTNVSGGSMISIKTKPVTSTDVKAAETVGPPKPAPVNAVISGNGLDVIKFPKQGYKKKITMTLK